MHRETNIINASAVCLITCHGYGVDWIAHRNPSELPYHPRHKKPHTHTHTHTHTNAFRSRQCVNTTIFSSPQFGCFRYLTSFSPKVSVDVEDATTRAPRSFVVNASFSFIAAPHSSVLHGVISMSGDWPRARAVSVPVDLPPSPSREQHFEATVLLHVDASDVDLWWPAQYGSPAMHTLSANVSWDAKALVSTPATIVSKRVGFRSVALDTGPAAPQSPTRVDPAHASSFVGCFRDGNIYWGGPQHVLPDLKSDDGGMTVSRCLQLCAGAGDNMTLAGLEHGTSCYCGTTIGSQCTGCLPGYVSRDFMCACIRVRGPQSRGMGVEKWGTVSSLVLFAINYAGGVEGGQSVWSVRIFWTHYPSHLTYHIYCVLCLLQGGHTDGPV